MVDGQILRVSFVAGNGLEVELLNAHSFGLRRSDVVKAADALRAVYYQVQSAPLQVFVATLGDWNYTLLDSPPSSLTALGADLGYCTASVFPAWLFVKLDLELVG